MDKLTTVPNLVSHQLLDPVILDEVKHFIGDRLNSQDVPEDGRKVVHELLSA